jgi:hypothetical protein
MGNLSDTDRTGVPRYATGLHIMLSNDELHVLLDLVLLFEWGELLSQDVNVRGSSWGIHSVVHDRGLNWTTSIGVVVKALKTLLA